MLSGGKFAGIWSGGYRGDTAWDILNDTTWTVPVTGWYQIDIRGGGGGGGAGGFRKMSTGRYYYYGGGGGGQSRHVEIFFLTKGTVLKITIGKGGSATANNDGGTGSATVIVGLITVAGGNGGNRSNGGTGDGGSGSGNCGASGSDGGSSTSAGSAQGGAGGGVAGERGSGGKGGNGNTSSPAGVAGSDGACYIKYLGQGYARN